MTLSNLFHKGQDRLSSWRVKRARCKRTRPHLSAARRHLTVGIPDACGRIFVWKNAFPINGWGRKKPRSASKRNVRPLSAGFGSGKGATNSSSEEHVAKQEQSANRDKVMKVLELYNEIVADFIQQYKSKKKIKNMHQLYIDAARNLKRNKKCLNINKQLGAVPGIEIGDQFQNRAALTVIGLHQQFYNGIDFMEEGGVPLATSIVASGWYDNHRKSNDVLIYSGNGGNPRVRRRAQLKDQKMRGGNLALENSMKNGTPVRVIYKVSFESCKDTTKRSMFVYDGLYLVERYWQEIGEFHKWVFKFLLKRIAGQPKLNWSSINNSGESTFHEDEEDLMAVDTDQGQENIASAATFNQ